jgi:hypothetical protein
LEGFIVDWTSLRKVSTIKGRKRAKTDRSDHSVSGEMDPKESPFKAVQSADQKGNQLHQKGNKL